MWGTIISVFLSFALMGVVGNRLLQSWQQRNWIEQKRLLDREQTLKSLRGLFDELSTLAGRRQFRAQRLLMAVASSHADVVTDRLAEYAEAVNDWNERLNSLYARLTMQLDYDYTKDLENIHNQFVQIGRQLERLASQKRQGKLVIARDVRGLSDSMNVQQGRLFVFERDVLKNIQGRIDAIYTEISLNEANLYTFPTWKLFVFLFKKRVYSR